MSDPVHIAAFMAVILLSCSGTGGGTVTTPPPPPEGDAASGNTSSASTDSGTSDDSSTVDAAAQIDALRAEAKADPFAALALMLMQTESAPEMRARLLAEVTDHYIEADDSARAIQMLDLADRSELGDEYLTMLGRGYALAGDIETARTIGEKLESGPHRDSLWVEIVGSLGLAGDVTGADEQLTLIEEPVLIAEAIIGLAAAQAGQGDLEAALARVDAIESIPHRVLGFVQVARAVGGDAAMDALLVALDTALEQPEDCEGSMVAIAELHVELGQINEAWTVARAIPTKEMASRAFVAIALYHAHQGNAFMAWKVSESIEHKASKLETLLTVLEMHVAGGDIDEALRVFKLVRKLSEKEAIPGLCLIGSATATVKEHKVSDELVMKAGSKKGREAVRACLAVQYAKVGNTDKANKYLGLLSGGQDDVKLAMARAYATAGKHKLVSSTIKGLAEKMKGPAHLQKVRALAVAGKLTEALELVPDIEDDYLRAEALLHIGASSLSKGNLDDCVERTREALGIGAQVDVAHFFSDDDVWSGKVERMLLYVHLMKDQQERRLALSDALPNLAGLVEDPTVLELIAVSE